MTDSELFMLTNKPAIDMPKYIKQNSTCTIKRLFYESL